MAEKQGAYGTVPNQQHVAIAGSGQYRFDFAHDTLLSIHRSFPSTYTLGRIRKEFVGDAFEVRRFQETRGRSIILMHGHSNVQLDPKGGGDWFGRLNGLSLSARDDLRCAAKPTSLDESREACACPTSFSPHDGDGNRWIDLYLWVGEIPNQNCQRFDLEDAAFIAIDTDRSTVFRTRTLGLCRSSAPCAQRIGMCRVEGPRL